MKYIDSEPRFAWIEHVKSFAVKLASYITILSSLINKIKILVIYLFVWKLDLYFSHINREEETVLNFVYLLPKSKSVMILINLSFLLKWIAKILQPYAGKEVILFFP